MFDGDRQSLLSFAPYVVQIVHRRGRDRSMVTFCLTSETALCVCVRDLCLISDFYIAFT
jgi:hypothetical protein